MQQKEIIGVLDLGTSTLKCLVGSVTENDSIKILGTSSVKSKGIHNGIITNLSDAANSIRSCLSVIEKKLNIHLKKMNIIIEPKEFSCTRVTKHKKIIGSKIQKDDIEYLLKETKNQIQLNNQMI